MIMIGANDSYYVSMQKYNFTKNFTYRLLTVCNLVPVHVHVNVTYTCISKTGWSLGYMNVSNTMTYLGVFGVEPGSVARVGGSCLFH